jgi:sugar lactone lactonase YvrE
LPEGDLVRIRHLVTAGVAALVAFSLSPATATASSPPTTSTTTVSQAANLHPHVVTAFPRGTDGAFAESVAVDRHGTLYVAVTTWASSGWSKGQIWKVTPDGRRTRFGPELSVGVLTGLAFDDHGRLYAGLAAWKDPALPRLDPGVLRIDATSATRVLTLPSGDYGVASFPNGLAVRGDALYVSDSIAGAIWRTHPHGTVNDVQTTPWLRSSLLAPSAPDKLGVNGIAFRGDGLFAVVSDTGLVVRIALGHHGTATAPQVLARSAALVSADGVAFDTHGDLWVTVNGGATPNAGSLLRVGADGHLTVVVKNPTWLDYPTQAAFGTTWRDRSTLYVTNGAFSSDGRSDVTAIHVSARGAWLPR